MKIHLDINSYLQFDKLWDISEEGKKVIAAYKESEKDFYYVLLYINGKRFYRQGEKTEIENIFNTIKTLIAD